MERWYEVFENEELTKSIVMLDAENAQQVLAQNGFDFTQEEIEKEIEIVKAAVEKAQSGELDENELTEVAGGITHKQAFAIGIVVGLCVATGAW